MPPPDSQDATVLMSLAHKLLRCDEAKLHPDLLNGIMIFRDKCLSTMVDCHDPPPRAGCCKTSLKYLAEMLLYYHNESDKLHPNVLYQLKNSFANGINRIFSSFLHDLDDTKHSEEQLQAVIDVFPEALSYKVNDLLPIQVTPYRPTSISFVPLLAREGRRHNVGGEEARGGLLSTDEGWTTIHGLILCGHKSEEYIALDAKCTQVLMSLKALELLHKEDIQKYNMLLPAAVFTSSQMRFEFLAQCDPEALKMVSSSHIIPIDMRGAPFILDLVNNLPSSLQEGLQCFENFLRVYIEHFPDDHLGFLFQNHGGESACRVLFDSFGVDETMEVIRRCIPQQEHRPILHVVAKHDPALMEDFVRYYPNAVYYRDYDNRTLFLVKLVSGLKRFAANGSFFLEATDKQVEEKDPVTGLFAFALAACGNTTDLAAVYVLLRRNPYLLMGGGEG